MVFKVNKKIELKKLITSVLLAALIVISVPLVRDFHRTGFSRKATADSTQLPVDSNANPADTDSGTLSAAPESYGNRVLDSLQLAIDSGRRSAIVRAVERMSPAVVSVNVTKSQVVTSAYRDFFGLYYVPREQQVENIGSGFIINSRGYIITNEHVVDGAGEVSVTTSDGKTFAAKIIGTDVSTDLALLQINPEGEKIVPAQLGDSDDLYIGEWAIAMGSPFGLMLDDPQPTVTVGVISAMGRDILGDRGERNRVYANMIQTDAAINPGNSGGPLINSLGEVIGINSFIFSPSGGSVGIGFAIPINRARRIADELIRGGKVRKPWLGVAVQNLSADILASMGYDTRSQIVGVLVSQVEDYSPAAENGGIAVGDILTKINNRKVSSVDDWESELIDIRVGSEVSLSVLRSGKNHQINLTPIERPVDTLTPLDLGIGFSAVDLTPQVRSQLGIRSRKGAVVVDINNNELSRTGSILPHDVLFKINNVEIESAAQAKGIIEKLPAGRRAVLFLERNGRLIRRYLTG